MAQAVLESKTSRFELKKPKAVYFLATIFLCAPFLNLAFSLYNQNDVLWYHPFRWWDHFKELALGSQLLLWLLYVAGVLLLSQRKRSWLLAVGVLLVISFINFQGFGADLQTTSFNTFIMMLANLACLVVLVFFRFPYLDNREKIFNKNSHRFKTHVNVEVEGVPSLGRIVNISRTGCFIQFEPKVQLPKVGSHILIILDDGMTLNGRVVHQRQFGIGLVFEYMFQHQRRDVLQLIRQSQL